MEGKSNNTRIAVSPGRFWKRTRTPRAPGFALFLAATAALFYGPLQTLMAFSLDYDELYSHIILIPVVSSYILYSGRKEIFSHLSYSYVIGGVIILAGMMLYLAGGVAALGQGDYISLATFSAVLFWTGGFIFFYGWHSAKKAAFPLLFLLFMVPIPSAAAESIIAVLQRGSTEAANGLFALTGVPYIREGFTFHLPSLSVEVAEQCSGIRSSLALFITSVLAGHLFLKTGWKKVVLALSIFPITVFKNGLRIVTLSLLGTYVDERILSSSLHQRGGILFFMLALLLWAPLLWLLRRSERWTDSGNKD